MKLTYKKATKDDVQAIAELADKIWKKHYISIITMEQIEYMLEMMYSTKKLSKQMDEGHAFTIIHLNSKPVGYISLSTDDHKNYFLQKFYIDLEEQAKGLGTQLLNYVISGIKSAETIRLTVNRKNYKAINFYFKNGFMIEGVADFDIGHGFFMNDFEMIRRITLR